MRHPLNWVAAALMFTGAALLLADVGTAGLWIAVVTVAIALMVVEGYRSSRHHHV